MQDFFIFRESESARERERVIVAGGVVVEVRW